MAAKTRASRKPEDGPPSLQKLYDEDLRAKQGPAVDHGARGKANRARPSRLVETAAAGVKQRVYEDADMLTLAVQANVITTRQQDALAKLCEHYAGWKSCPKVCASYGRSGGAAELSAHQEKSRQAYYTLLNQAPEDTRHALATIAFGEWPIMGNAIGLIRRGSTALADHLRLPA